MRKKGLQSYALWDSINLKVNPRVFQGQLPFFVDKQNAFRATN